MLTLVRNVKKQSKPSRMSNRKRNRSSNLNLRSSHSRRNPLKRSNPAKRSNPVKRSSHNLGTQGLPVKLILHSLPSRRVPAAASRRPWSGNLHQASRAQNQAGLMQVLHRNRQGRRTRLASQRQNRHQIPSRRLLPPRQLQRLPSHHRVRGF